MPSFLHLTTPINLAKEKERFLASHTYNPVFHYSWQDNPHDDYSHTDPLKHKLYAAILIQDSEAMTAIASKLFAVTATDLLHDLATNEIKNQPKVTMAGGARAYAELLEKALKEFDLDYQVVISPKHGFNARPNHSKQKIVVSESIHYELFSMEGGVRHELAHALRFANGEFNHIPRSLYYLPTEEGLASYVQDNVLGVIDRSRAQHAIEYLGSEIGARSSLRDIFNFMVDSGMSEELAWKRASRHKFGFVDTSKPGDIMKPAMYFVNEMKIKALSIDERLRLFVGKIALNELPNHPTYKGLWPAAKLQSYFNL